MSAVLTSPLPLARPKIHRLPASCAARKQPKLPGHLRACAPYAAGGAVVMALLAGIPPQPAGDKTSVNQTQAKRLPQISVTPQAPKAAQIPPKAAQEPASFSMNDAPLPSLSARVTDCPACKTIILQGGNDSIIGQMARIPLENEPITEIKSASDIDNHAGRELLSIINKY
jgi:hypothetical protein